MKPEVTPGMKKTLDWFCSYLKLHGIPNNTIKEIRMALVYDAVTESKNIQYDRIYASIALMLHKEFNFGQQRILRGLRCFDQQVGSVLDPETDWTDVMNELKDDVGIIVRSGDGDRLVVECLTEEERANYKYGEDMA